MPDAATIQPKPLRSGFSAKVWLIIVGGMVARLLAQWFLSDNLSSDPDAYLRLAKSLVEGDGLSIADSDQPSAFRPPLFPILLAIPQLLSVSTSVSVALVLLAFSFLLLIGTAQLSRELQFGEGYQLVIVSVVALDPLLLQYCTVPMTEIPATAALSWAAVFCVRLLYHASDSSSGRISAAVKAGLCFGCGGLCRPILFPVCLLATLALATVPLRRIWAAQRVRKSGDDTDSWQRRLLVSLVPAMVAGILLAPWVFRNLVQMQAFIPATTHGGYTLLLGNNPVFYEQVVNGKPGATWQGDSLNRWTQSLENELNRDGVSPTDEVARDRWMYARAEGNIQADPDSFYAACRLRMQRFWSILPASVRQRSTSVQMAIASFYVLIWFGLLLQLLAGTTRILGWRKAIGSELPGAELLLWSCVVGFLCIHAVYWTNTRMRAPVMPLLTVLSAFGYRILVSRVRFKKQCPK